MAPTNSKVTLSTTNITSYTPEQHAYQVGITLLLKSYFIERHNKSSKVQHLL